MILASHGIIGSQIVQFSFDADYEAILNYATTQSYTLPSTSQQLLQNQLVVDLKNAGIWSKLDTFAVFATDGDRNFALIDWIRTINYTAFNTPTFTTNEGFEGNGTSAYINTNFTLSSSFVNASQNNQSAFSYNWKDASPLNNFTFGNNLNAIELSLNPRNPGNVYANRIGSNATTTASYIQTVGLHTLTRNNASNFDYYIDGINQVNITSTSTSYTTSSIHLFASPSISFFANGACSILGFGASLDATENLDLYNALNNYYTAL